MQPTQKLTRALHDLLMLVEQEAAQNPAFAERLAAITADLPAIIAKKPKAQRRTVPSSPPPDVFAAHQEKGPEEFRYWLRSFDLGTLKGIVKINGFDPGKITRQWKEPDKFIELIADQTASRLRRGHSFLPTVNSTLPPTIQKKEKQ